MPYAGGGTVPFRPWLAQLPASVEVLAALLPGREGRLGEPPSRDLGTVVRGLAAELAGRADRLPTVVFGHSLGAFVGYELCRWVGAVVPVRHLVVSGSRAPHRPPAVEPIAHLPEAEFLAAVRRLGGAPAEAFDEPVLMELMEPALRADFAIAEAYRLAEPAPLPVPLTVLGGAEDPVTSVAELACWQAYSAVSCTVRVFPGGHFFTVTEQDAVLSEIRAVLESTTVA